MTEAEPGANTGEHGNEESGAEVRRVPVVDRVTRLRGPATVGIGRRLWLSLGVLGLLTFAVAIVVSLLSANNDNVRIERLKAHGVPVAVTVTDCIGNIGGSGSNSAGYTCHGDYTVGGTAYHELLGSKSTFSAPGTVVRGVADPSRNGTVVLASALKTSVVSSRAYLPAGLLTVVLIVLTLALLRVARRSEPPRGTPPATSSPQGH